MGPYRFAKRRSFDSSPVTPISANSASIEAGIALDRPPARPEASRRPFLIPIFPGTHRSPCRPILNHTERGEAIYDAFLGSGTSLVAAELTGRVCCGLEIEAQYLDLIVCRWEQLTGKRATLDEDGRSFDEIQAERLA
jgi:hypothetical protein